MKKNERLFIDMHVLQTVPPSCINRDDTGSPKTAIYGGALRARVSSQSWKRAMRTMFRDFVDADKLAMRTKRIVGLLAEEIQRLDDSLNASAAAVKVLKNSGLTIKSEEKGTDALFFISIAQVKALAAIAVENPDALSEKPARETKAKLQAALKNQAGIEVALFGRMVADDPSLNTDASAQIAHSISTHRISNEYDYFTAVDDLSPEDNAGAGHIGTVEYNSATLYRYGTVAVHKLYEYLEEDTPDAVKEFVRAFVCSMPMGKQNTFANRTLPDGLFVSVRADQPINLAGAFERPIPESNEGFVSNSSKRLVEYTKQMYKDFATEPKRSFVTGDLLADLGEAMPLQDLLDAIRSETENFISVKESEE